MQLLSFILAILTGTMQYCRPPPTIISTFKASGDAIMTDLGGGEEGEGGEEGGGRREVGKRGGGEGRWGRG